MKDLQVRDVPIMEQIECPKLIGHSLSGFCQLECADSCAPTPELDSFSANRQ